MFARSRLEIAPFAAPAAVAARFTAAIAIPAKDEEAEIEGCLGALAGQRGTPLDDVVVLLLVNNSTDATAEIARRLGPSLPYRLMVREVVLPAGHIGLARRLVMDEAAALLGPGPGLLLTTDADSRVDEGWLAANRAAIARGADAVAGAIRFDATDTERRGAAGLRRARLEEAYAAALAEIEARLDPERHDPWPRHRGASGASLAVTLDAYRQIGGVPVVRVAEDRALAAAVEAHGLRLRRDPDVRVVTSARLEGRAPGGAAETLLRRAREPQAPCDEALEPLPAAVRRIRWRRRLRDAAATGTLAVDLAWSGRLGLSGDRAAAISRLEPFGLAWKTVEAESPVLRPVPLAPRRLALDLAAARAALAALRAAEAVRSAAAARAGSRRGAPPARGARSDARP